MDIKVIKSKTEYEDSLKLVEGLISKDPLPGSPEGERLELLLALIKDYESKVFPNSIPDPVEAIKVRMQELNLKPVDLTPYFGSKSRVSEVLSGKRNLSVKMMRSLEKGLGIPAKILLREPGGDSQEDSAWDDFPIVEMEKRGYFSGKIYNSLGEKLEDFFSNVGSPLNLVGLLRKTEYIRSEMPMNKYALSAWSAKVVNEAKKVSYPEYNAERLTIDQIREIISLSIEPDGPLLAKKALHDIGIALIIEPHLSQTYLDGAAILVDPKLPIIGLTLRYDSIDNFWFNLVHELAHVYLHRDKGLSLFYDDLMAEDRKSLQEIEADEFASELLIPAVDWDNSAAKNLPSPEAAQLLAKKLNIHIAIVAGKIRYEGGNYKFLNESIGRGSVRVLFNSKE